MNYKAGQKLQFNVYDTIIEGAFIRTEVDLIIIMTTEDYIKENIGTEQSIHKSHKHKEIE